MARNSQSEAHDVVRVQVQVGNSEVQAQVEGRAARLIAWLVFNYQRVNEPAKGNLQVDFAGQSLKYRLTDCFDS